MVPEVVSELLTQASTLSDVIKTFSGISNWLRHWAPLLGAAAGLVVLYRFFLVGPSLALESEAEAVSRPQAFDVMRVTPTMYLENHGRAKAEDIYINIELEDWEFHRQSDERPSSVLRINENQTGYVGAPGRIYEVFVDTVLHRGARFKIFFGGTQMERGRTYELDYTVACRGHRERSGKILYHVGHQDVEVEHVYPGKWLRLKKWIANVWDRVTSDNPELTLEQYDEDWIDERTVRVTGKAKNTGSQRLRYPNARIEVFQGSVSTENFFQAVPMQITALDTGEIWKTEVTLEFENGLTRGDLELREVLEPDTNKAATPWEGVQLVDSKIDLPTDDDPTIRAHGRIENTNAGTDRRVHVVVKFYNADGEVIADDDTTEKLEAGEAKDFSMYPAYDSTVKNEIDEGKIILMG